MPSFEPAVGCCKKLVIVMSRLQNQVQDKMDLFIYETQTMMLKPQVKKTRNEFIFPCPKTEEKNLPWTQSSKFYPNPT